MWQALVPLYNSVEELKEKTWLSVQPRKLRQSLDELLAQLKQLPAKFRSYDSYNYAKKALQNYSKAILKFLLTYRFVLLPLFFHFQCIVVVSKYLTCIVF